MTIEQINGELVTLLQDYGHLMHSGARERIERIVGKTYQQICEEAV